MMGCRTGNVFGAARGAFEPLALLTPNSPTVLPGPAVAAAEDVRAE